MQAAMQDAQEIIIAAREGESGGIWKRWTREPRKQSVLGDTRGNKVSRKRSNCFAQRGTGLYVKPPRGGIGFSAVLDSNWLYPFFQQFEPRFIHACLDGSRITAK